MWLHVCGQFVYPLGQKRAPEEEAPEREGALEGGGGLWPICSPSLASSQSPDRTIIPPYGVVIGLRKPVSGPCSSWHVGAQSSFLKFCLKISKPKFFFINVIYVLIVENVKVLSLLYTHTHTHTHQKLAVTSKISHSQQ